MNIFERILEEAQDRRDVQDQHYQDQRAKRNARIQALVDAIPRRYAGSPVSDLDLRPWAEWILAHDGTLTVLEMARHIERETGEYCDYRSITGLLMGLRNKGKAKAAPKADFGALEAAAQNPENRRPIGRQEAG